MIDRIILFLFGAAGILAICTAMRVVNEFFNYGKSGTYIKIGTILARIAGINAYEPRHAENYAEEEKQ